MASSGRMTGNSISIGGVGNQYFFVDWQLASQSIQNNTSTINWQAYFHFTTADAQLDNGDVVAGGATRWDVPGRVYNYTGNFTTRDLALASGSFTVTHDSVGNYTLGVSGAITAFSSGTSSGSASWALTQIPRYANITSYTSSAVTDVGFTLNVVVDATCDLLEYSTNNGSTYTSVAGDFTSKSVVITGLASETIFPTYVRVRRKDSQLKTTSSLLNVTTARQNNFFAFI